MKKYFLSRFRDRLAPVDPSREDSPQQAQGPPDQANRPQQEAVRHDPGRDTLYRLLTAAPMEAAIRCGRCMKLHRQSEGCRPAPN